MDKSSKDNRFGLTNMFRAKKMTVILAAVAVMLLLLLIMMLILFPDGRDAPAAMAPSESVPSTGAPAAIDPATGTESPTDPIPTVAPVQGEVDQEMLPHMAQWYAKNADVIGYLRIPDTKIDNVVMYTPEDGTKYLYRSIEGKFRAAGELLMDARCEVDPESTVLMIHGHNMLNGTMFKDLLNYSVKGYWKNHSVIYYSSLYEERTYEVFAAFFDRVYDVDEDVFKFYQFINPQTEEEYNEGIAYFKRISEFDSGITPEFGDRLLMLVTCEYSTPNGRFVVVAREVTEEE